LYENRRGTIQEEEDGQWEVGEERIMRRMIIHYTHDVYEDVIKKPIILCTILKVKKNLEFSFLVFPETFLINKHPSY
jgi:hypothetical protein